MKQLLFSIFTVFSIFSYACSCAIPKLDKKYADADFVADITIIKVYKNKNDEERYKADIKINTLYKGDAIKSIYIYGRSDNKIGNTCAIYIPEGTKLIAYSKYRNNIHRIGMCSGLLYLERSGEYWKKRLNNENYKKSAKKELDFLKDKLENVDKNNSTQETKDYSSNVATIDSTIKTLYTVISSDAGVERDWELFKYLFHKDAKLIPSGKNQEGKHVARYMTPDDYINSSGKWLLENGFHEVELNREVQSFGNITQVFSTYESYREKEDKEPFMRGINSIQLMNDGERWWIINIFWMQESKNNPIPEAYLPKN